MTTVAAVTQRGRLTDDDVAELQKARQDRATAEAKARVNYERAVARVAQRASVRTVAAALGISKTTVQKYVDNHR